MKLEERTQKYRDEVASIPLEKLIRIYALKLDQIAELRILNKIKLANDTIDWDWRSPYGYVTDSLSPVSAADMSRWTPAHGEPPEGDKGLTHLVLCLVLSEFLPQASRGFLRSAKKIFEIVPRSAVAAGYLDVKWGENIYEKINNYVSQLEYRSVAEKIIKKSAKKT